jgi:hypothetical protein
MQPISIHAPHWTRPALLGPSRTFQVIADARPDDMPSLALIEGQKVVPVRIEQTEQQHRGLIQYTCTVLGGRAGVLYDLELRTQDTRAKMRRAVSVLPEDTTALALLHCTDLHLLTPVAEQGMLDRSALVAALVAHINALRPDLVVCTGDVISRYDTHKRVLPADTIRWQIRRAVELLAPIEVPFFVTLGNHDAAFAATREDWYAAMGGGWHGGTDEYSLDWGDYHLAMMDCFAHYDPQNVVLRHSFTNEQLDWLCEDLRATSERQQRLVFAHYDYRKQLPALFPELRVDALFYGHARGMYPDVLAQHGIWDGHLADTQAYNLVRLTPEGINSEKLSWASLGSQPCFPRPC